MEGIFAPSLINGAQQDDRTQKAPTTGRQENRTAGRQQGRTTARADRTTETGSGIMFHDVKYCQCGRKQGKSAKKRGKKTFFENLQDKMGKMQEILQD